MPWSGPANVSDYDLVLVNLLKLKEESARKQVYGVKFQSLLDFTVTPDVLIHSGHIVILGDHRFSIPDWRSEGEERDFLYWTGISLAWDDHPGDTIHYARYNIVESSEFRRYFHPWSYSLHSARPVKAALKEKWSLDQTRDEAAKIHADKKLAAAASSPHAFAP